MITMTEKEVNYLGIEYYFRLMKNNVEWFKKMNNQDRFISYTDEGASRNSKNY